MNRSGLSADWGSAGAISGPPHMEEMLSARIIATGMSCVPACLHEALSEGRITLLRW